MKGLTLAISLASSIAAIIMMIYFGLFCKSHRKSKSEHKKNFTRSLSAVSGIPSIRSQNTFDHGDEERFDRAFDRFALADVTPGGARSNQGTLYRATAAGANGQRRKSLRKSKGKKDKKDMKIGPANIDVLDDSDNESDSEIYRVDSDGLSGDGGSSLHYAKSNLGSIKRSANTGSIHQKKPQQQWDDRARRLGEGARYDKNLTASVSSHHSRGSVHNVYQSPGAEDALPAAFSDHRDHVPEYVHFMQQHPQLYQGVAYGMRN